jgi:predicted RNA-binding protein with PUA-like domain
MSKKYWLVKSEPDVFSLEDLKKCKDQTTYWDGVRNYQARNYIRDEMKKGDGVFFYYSGSEPMGIFGICEITKEGYPDHTQFDPGSPHYFASAGINNPVWFMADIKLIEIFDKPVTLQLIKDNPKLKNMRLIQKGNRLSVMPVEKDEWNEVVRISK